MFKGIIIVVIILFTLIGGILIFRNNQNRRIQRQEVQYYKQDILNFSAEEVIEHHYKWKSTGNLEGLELTLYETRDLDMYRGARNIKLLSLSEIEDSEKIDWIRNLNWFPDHILYSKIFYVDFSFQGETYNFIYVVVKETSESPWLIYRRFRDV